MASQVAAQADRTGAGVDNRNCQMSSRQSQKLAAWVNEHLDLIAFMVGLTGFTLFVTGIGFVYWPAALIVAGAGLLGWSFMVARAVAARNTRKTQEH
jgi:hypothetical protein